MRIAIIGGTGREGQGLAIRWASAGHDVALGSRDAERARGIAAELTSKSGGRGTITGGAHVDGLKSAEIVVLSVPYAGHGETVRALAPHLEGKLVVDITVPIQPPKVTSVHLPPGQAAALEAQEILGTSARVVAALHHVSAVHLADPAHAIDCDVLVCGDDPAARTEVAALIESLGLRAIDAGPLRNAIALESLTPVLLHINRRYKIPGAGLRITGL